MISIKELKEDYQMIHFFGLGFVQLKINDTFRYHFYHPSINSFMHDEEVHNHRYNFKSEILAGQLEEDLYQFLPHPDGQYILEFETCSPTQKAPEHTEVGELNFIKKNIHVKGNIYERLKTDFHKVRTNFCITKLTREISREDFAKVIRQKDHDKICPFGRPMNEEECWKLVEDCLNIAAQKKENT